MVLQNPDRSLARPVQHQVIEFATAVVVKGKGPVSCGFKVVPADTLRLIDRYELPFMVLQNPDRTATRPVQHQVIKFATGVVIEGKGPVNLPFKIVSADTIARVTWD